MRKTGRVYVAVAPRRKKKTYQLVWLDPVTRKWKRETVGTDRRRAEKDAVRREQQLEDCTYQSVKRSTWGQFVERHVAQIPGEANRKEARRTLDEFGRVCNPPRPRDVSFAMIEQYVAHLRTDTDDHRTNSQATVNKKLRYLRAAFNLAVDRDYMAKNPLSKWRWQREDQKVVRVLNDDEQKALLNAAESVYGFRWRGFIDVALNTGARRGELLSLAWEHVELDEASVTFVRTKGKKDRTVPLSVDTVVVLRRLKAQTIQQGGPFIGMGDNLGRQWNRIRKAAQVTNVTIHDLRRTFVTRLIRLGVPVPTVQQLAGHSSFVTTLKHYNLVSEKDKREGIAKLSRTVAG